MNDRLSNPYQRMLQAKKLFGSEEDREQLVSQIKILLGTQTPSRYDRQILGFIENAVKLNLPISSEENDYLRRLFPDIMRKLHFGETGVLTNLGD